MDIVAMERELEKELPGLPVRRGEPMRDHTTFCIGGPADLWCRPETIDQLAGAVRFATGAGVPYFLIGNGSNLLVRDGGIRGLVIETTALEGVTLPDEGVVEAECGISLTKLAVYARDRALTGLEFAYGIPGTVGGAVYMNAGAYGGEMKHCVIETDYADAQGNVHTLRGEEHRFDYRRSFFTEVAGTVILRTRLRLAAGDPAAIQEKMQELKRRRQESQPLQSPSAGSFFKRPAGYFAGKLISDSGLKGCAVGDAKVSEKHAGFLVNDGKATCCDVLRLMEKVQRTVRERFGVSLEPEVKIVGESARKE